MFLTKFSLFGRAFLLLLAIFSCSYSYGQQLQLLLDPINPFQKQSLYQLSILNNSDYSGQLNLKATLKNRRGKVLMVQELTESIASNASKSIRGNNVTPRTTYIDADFNRLYQQSNQLPALNYVLCIDAHGIGDLGSKVQECIEYQASDFINITAVYPPNEEIIYDQRPLFTWFDLGNSYTYNFTLVEVEEGQNENVALRRNAPIVSTDNLSEQQLLFPADAQALENEKEYAWQLTLVAGGEIITRSEPFHFTYKESEQYIDIPRNLSYVDITEIENGATLYAVGEFKFKFPSHLENELSISLFEPKKSKQKKLDLPENQFTVEKGVNKFELDLKDQVYLKHLKTYRLSVADTKNKKTYQFSVIYVNPDYIK